MKALNQTKLKKEDPRRKVLVKKRKVSRKKKERQRLRVKERKSKLRMRRKLRKSGKKWPPRRSPWQKPRWESQRKPSPPRPNHQWKR